MDGIFGLIQGITSGPAPKLGRDVVNGYLISTVDSYDQGPETAVIDSGGTHVVQRYYDKAEALKGHKKWVKRAEKFKPGKKLTDVGYPVWGDEEQFVLTPPEPPK